MATLADYTFYTHSYVFPENQKYNNIIYNKSHFFVQFKSSPAPFTNFDSLSTYALGH